MPNLVKPALPFALLLMTLSAHADDKVPVDDILGSWLTEKKGAVIEMYECGVQEETELCGRIAWLKKPYTDEGKLKRDPENPNPALRERPLCGIRVFSGLKRTDKDTWAFGDVYNPKDGNEYSAYFDAKDDGTLHIRAYIGIPLIGKSETWSRPQGMDIGCPSE